MFGNNEIKNPQLPINVQYADFKCTQGRSRTGTALRPQVFETSASTNSATWATMNLDCEIIKIKRLKNTFMQFNNNSAVNT
jgi:hypothetical protein